METDRGGSGSAMSSDLARGKKRPPSPSTPPGDEGHEWLISDSDEDEENLQETHRPFTVEGFPRVTCEHGKQSELVYETPEINLRGPPAVMLFSKDVFDYYNLEDESELSVRDAGDCSNGCRCVPMCVLQFISAKIAGYQPTRSGPVKISGFVAARDTTEPLRNYVYRPEINNCEDVTVKSKTGVARLSLSSPARVISFSSRVLIESELHAWIDEETDGLIIEGYTELRNMFATKSFMKHNRLYGERCALDIKYLVLINALEACVDVKVLRLGTTPGGLNLKLCAKTSNFDEVICLFDGASPDPGGTMSFVVAAQWRKGIDLCIEGSARDGPFLGTKRRPLPRCECFFAAGYHAMDERVAEVGEFATVSVKVNWTTHWKKARGVGVGT